MSRMLRRLGSALPQGSALPEPVYLKRHGKIVLGVVLGLLTAWVAALGRSAGHAPGEGGPDAVSIMIVALAVCAMLSWLLRGRPRWGASLASAALMLLCALAVHLSGTIEAHFLFFIVIPIVALYEDWLPFATAAGIVFVHHVAMAVVDPGQIFNHAAALEAPMAWSLIHVALFAAICITSLIHWRIHERARAEETALRTELKRQALQDPLTGLGNRTLFVDSLAQVAAWDSPGARSASALMILDINDFKGINDVHGHPVGDVVLSEVAARLKACVRSTDTVARLGGDEFAVLMPAVTEETAAAAARRILAVLGEPVGVGQAVVSVGASVGVALSSGPMLDQDDLYERADRAMYEAKRSGRGLVVEVIPTLSS